MKERIQGVLVGVLIGAICTGGAAFAKSKTENIEVTYDNIKVFKDNVLCELKDGNGSVIEPFIYNGTTYMPVRGTANLADMEVTWDGNTKSVYLWDTMVPEGTYLMEVAPPYEKKSCSEYLQQKGQSFTMSGTNYSNGFILGDYNGYAMFNLNSKYSKVEFTVGHIDGTSLGDTPVSFFVDGKLVKEITVEAESMPKTISLPVSYGLQLKVVTGDGDGSPRVGFANITVH